MTGMGMGSDVDSFESICSGMSGAISGEDRAVGAVDPAGDGATAGIILGEDITVDPAARYALMLEAPGVRTFCIWLAISVED